MNEHELYHHGIKGMKWGVRRYQNKDGTLTAAGQKRYDSYEKKKNKAKQYASMNRAAYNNSFGKKHRVISSANRLNEKYYSNKAAKYERKQQELMDPTPKKGMSTKKKVAIGVGVAAVAAGTAFVAYKYKKGMKEASRQYSEAGKKYYAKALEHHKQHINDRLNADINYSIGNFKESTRYGDSAHKHKEFYDLTDAMTKNAYTRAQHPSIKDAYRAARGKSVTGDYAFNYRRAGNGDTDLGLANYIAKGYKADTKKRLDRKGTMKEVVLPSAAILGGIGAGGAAVSNALNKGIQKGDQKAYERYKKEHPNTKLSDEEIRYITSQGRYSKSRR